MKNKIINNIVKAEIAPSNLHGFGLFASTKLKASEILTILDGQLVPWEYIKKGCENSEWNAISKEQALYRPFKTKYYFINHSRSPNLHIKTNQLGFLEIQVLNDLNIGEELLLDYRKEPLPEWYVSDHGATYL